MMAVRSLRATPVRTQGGAAAGEPAVLVASSQGVRRPDNARTSRTRALLTRRVGLAVAAATAVTAVHPQHFLPVLSGGGAGGGAGGSGGGSGGSGGGHGRWFGAQAAFAESDYFDEEDDSRRGPQPSAGAQSSLEDEEKFLVEAVKASNLPTGPGIPSKVCTSPVGSDLPVCTSNTRRRRTALQARCTASKPRMRLPPALPRTPLLAPLYGPPWLEF